MIAYTVAPTASWSYVLAVSVVLLGLLLLAWRAAR